MNNKIVLFPALEHYSSESKRPLDLHDFFSGNLRNGLGILTPTSCTCTRELRGEFSLSLEVRNPEPKIEPHLKNWVHIAAPVLGRWDESGLVYKKHQIFYITEVQRNEDESGNVIYTIQARHIFYNLLLFKSGNSWQPHNAKCAEVLSLLTYGNTMYYNFTSSSDCEDERFVKLPSDTTNVALLLDEGNILDMFGCELHRDNFKFSANKGRKEFSKGTAFAPAFRFIVGKEIKSVTESKSYPDSMTGTAYVAEETETGTETKYTVQIPSSKIGSPVGTFGEPVTYTKDSSESLTDARFKVEQLLKRKAFPENSCVASLCDIKNSDTYKNMLNVAACDIGDVGVVYSPNTKKSVVQICTRTVEDVLKGSYTEITLGTVPGSISRNIDNSSYVGMQKYYENSVHVGNFTAKVTVSPGKNKVHALSRFMYELSDLSFDADVSYGDSYIHTMSSASDEGDVHEYAYPGEYQLSYTANFDDSDYPHIDYPYFDGVLDSPVMQTAIIDAGNEGYADIDDIVFAEGTTKIGQTTAKQKAAVFNTMLSKGVFNNCQSITKITIPASVKYISNFFIQKCYSVKEIVYGGTLSEWAELLQKSHEQDDKIASGVTEKLYDMYNVSVECSDGSTVWNGQLGANPAYGV